MKNIQAQYQDLLEGKMSKANFMRNVRMQFPQHISPTTSYDDSVKILKGKRILSEAFNLQELSPELRNKAFKQATAQTDTALGKKDPLKADRRYRQSLKFGGQIDPGTFDKVESLFKDTEYVPYIDKLPPKGDTGEVVILTLVKNGQIGGKIRVEIKKDSYNLPSTLGIPTPIQRKLENAIKIIQNKEIAKEHLQEDKKPIGVYGHNPNAEMDEYRRIDHLNYYQVYHGLQFELAKMPEITDENYIKARKKVVDTILKDPDAYKDLQLANFKAVKEMDKDLEMKEVKKNNLTDKPNEMKVVAKNAKGNTQDSLGKKEAKKAKNGKGLQHMTQTPKGKLEAFATPGKEKVMALKEHILDEMTTLNPHHEDIHKGMVVFKKKGDSGPGKVIEFDGHTATVEWENGTKEDVQKNVLTKQEPAKTTTELPSSELKPRTMVQWSNKEEGKVNEDPIGQQTAGDPEKEKEMRDTLIKKVKEGVLKTIEELLFKDPANPKAKPVVASKPQSMNVLKASGLQAISGTEDVK